MNKKSVIVIVMILAVIGVGAYLLWKDPAQSNLAVHGTDDNIPAVGTVFPEQGREHILAGAAHDPYNSNPPTSGPHYAQPAEWGVYQISLPDEQLIHNLEHGGIWISYKDIDQDTKDKLETIAKANLGSVIMTPRAANDSRIVLASWTRLEKMDSYDEAKILEFVRANKNKSPEPLAK